MQPVLEAHGEDMGLLPKLEEEGMHRLVSKVKVADCNSWVVVGSILRVADCIPWVAGAEYSAVWPQ